MQPHDDWGEGHASLNSVLSHSVDQGLGEGEVKVTDEDNAVWILVRNSGGRSETADFTHASPHLLHFECGILTLTLSMPACRPVVFLKLPFNLMYS